jgi:hypothetical protein
MAFAQAGRERRVTAVQTQMRTRSTVSFYLMPNMRYPLHPEGVHTRPT